MAGEGSRRPQDSNFYQQRLKAWQPILTPKWVVISFVVVGVIFLPVGLILKAASDSVVEFKVQYDGKGTDAGAISGSCTLDAGAPANKTCSINIAVDEDMEPPIYVYYELERFYQNHRRYVKSRSDEQLDAGSGFQGASLDNCDPLKTSDGGKTLVPCGLIANSMFNDTINLIAGPQMHETGIAWKSDREKKFKAVPDASKAATRADNLFLEDIYPGVLRPDPNVPNSPGATMENEHFIVWMRTAALPHFRKLYGRIDTKVNKGDTLQFDIVSRFRVSSFDGKKSLVVSTTSWLGGKNPFLGIAYIVVGALCLALALFFGLKQKFSGRNLGDTDLLVWNTSRR